MDTQQQQGRPVVLIARQRNRRGDRTIYGQYSPGGHLRAPSRAVGKIANEVQGLAMEADVGSQADADRLIAETIQAYGRLAARAVLVVDGGASIVDVATLVFG
jgi:hypothetical protein